MKKKKMIVKIVLSCIVLGGLIFAGVVTAKAVRDGDAFIEASLNTQNTSSGELDKKYTAMYDSSGYEFQNAEIISHDGLTLSGTEIHSGENEHKWVLMAHGFKANRLAMSTQAKVFLENGYNILTIDQRGYGLSEGTYSTFGALEKGDVLLWAKYIAEKDSDAKIVLFGESMGAATVMLAAGEPDIPSQIVAVIEDCGYTSIYDMIKFGYGDKFNKFNMDLISIYLKFRIGVDLKSASALNAVARTSLPILFIHGDADNSVPVRMAQELYDACNSEKELLIVKGAAHVQSVNTDQELYFKTIFDFLNKYIEE